ncbi:MAG: cyclic nucleotide-binding domain-containing protein [Rhodospirillales bacterium]|nr:cyclic nucleotide-binding domain-containing protein [Rhodospirillales bacterium]
MTVGALGKEYAPGEVIVRQGEIGECMYVVQEGTVEVIVEKGGVEAAVGTMGKNDFFGEMSIFGGEVRSATVRSVDSARILTIDKKNFLRGINDDPSLAFRMLKNMSKRIRELNDEASRRSDGDRRTHRRFSVSIGASLSVNGEDIAGTLLDLSYRGCFMRIDREIQIGQPVTLHLPSIDRGIETEVRRTSEDGLLGLHFSSPLPEWKKIISQN